MWSAIGRPSTVNSSKILHRKVMMNPQGVGRSNATIPLSDGLLSAADIYWTDAPGPRPVVLERTPYGRRKPRASDQDTSGNLLPDPVDIAQVFTEGGFIVVRQDTRGRGDSSGAFVKYLGEAEDGAAAIAWLRAQPWCDGRVVTMGVSYSAHAQLAAATQSPAGLAAMFLDSGGFTSGYEVGIRKGGAFELKQLTWAIRNAQISPLAASEPWRAQCAADTTAVLESYRLLPWRPGASPLRALPDYEEYILEQWRQQDRSAYWSDPSIDTRELRRAIPDVPVHLLVSWYDPYVEACIENFQWLSERHVSPTSLVIGPWIHGRRCETFAGDVDFGPDADFSRQFGGYADYRVRWFSSVLAGDAVQDAVHFFLMGGGSGGRTATGRLDHGGCWLSDSAWPPQRAVPMTLVLTADRQLVGEAGAVAAPGRIVFEADPEHPVPTIGGQVTSGAPIMFGGAYNQIPDERLPLAEHLGIPLDARADVIAFRTEPLLEPLVITGMIKVALDIQCSTPDADITAKLIDEYPPSPDFPGGFAMNLSQSILRLRYRESFDEPSQLLPEETYTVEIRLPDTANLFAIGHRIRLDISTSDFPRFDVNPNTGEVPGLARTSQKTTITLLLGASSSSRLQMDALRCE